MAQVERWFKQHCRSLEGRSCLWWDSFSQVSWQQPSPFAVPCVCVGKFALHIPSIFLVDLVDQGSHIFFRGCSWICYLQHLAPLGNPSFLWQLSSTFCLQKSHVWKSWASLGAVSEWLDKGTPDTANFLEYNRVHPSVSHEEWPVTRLESLGLPARGGSETGDLSHDRKGHACGTGLCYEDVSFSRILANSSAVVTFMIGFQALFTWLLYSFGQLPIVVVPTVLSAILALVPKVSPVWSISVWAAVYLWFHQQKACAALHHGFERSVAHDPSPGCPPVWKTNGLRVEWTYNGFMIYENLTNSWFLRGCWTTNIWYEVFPSELCCLVAGLVLALCRIVEWVEANRFNRF